ncbi:acetyltransferase [Streptomyces acidiscabies]
MLYESWGYQNFGAWQQFLDAPRDSTMLRHLR